MRYTSSYGFIPQTFALDDDPLDIVIYNNIPIQTGMLLEVKPIAVLDMTDNETAKLHVRHMVGGRVGNGNADEGTGSELLFRFEFPERPGALLKFLTGLGARWNISMFHYRNHGAAWGRVLVGLQAAPSERRELADYLSRIGFRYWEETDNRSVELFLK